MAHMHNPNAYLICNGYKDDEFIDLALEAQAEYLDAGNSILASFQIFSG
ncbi:hypothetical protein [Akkermansia muciniphila]|nr:hypothetical protein [Akkermansia muciniphila]